MIGHRAALPSENLLRLVAPVINHGSLVIAHLADNGARAAAPGQGTGTFAECAPAERAVVHVAIGHEWRVDTRRHDVAREQAYLHNHAEADADDDPFPLAT